MSKKRYEWIFENGENEIIDNITGQYVTISSPELLNEKEQKIADIEAKLAEKEEELLQKEKKIEDLMLCEFVSTALDFNKLSADNCRLREQLAEKEKENTKLKEVVDCVDKLKQFNADMNDYALVNRDVADEIYCEHQDKISFAVEQLEQLRHDIWTNQQDDGYTDMQVDLYDLNDMIDIAIGQLTHQHEDKGE